MDHSKKKKNVMLTVTDVSFEAFINIMESDRTLGSTKQEFKTIMLLTYTGGQN